MHEARCSFCGKPASAVQALIKAPEAASKAGSKGHDEVYICTECIRACAAILDSGDGEKLLVTTQETVQ